jgi:hypothetical protein
MRHGSGETLKLHQIGKSRFRLPAIKGEVEEIFRHTETRRYPQFQQQSVAIWWMPECPDWPSRVKPQNPMRRVGPHQRDPDIGSDLQFEILRPFKAPRRGL